MLNEDHNMVMIEMTEERKAQWIRLCNAIIDLLEPEVTPYEAYGILKYCIGSLERTYDIKGSLELDKS